MDITAYHVMFEFQNHFVEQLDDDSSDKKKKEYTLSQYLEYGFKNQKTNVKYTYKLFGDFSKNHG